MKGLAKAPRRPQHGRRALRNLRGRNRVRRRLRRHPARQRRLLDFCRARCGFDVKPLGEAAAEGAPGADRAGLARPRDRSPESWAFRGAEPGRARPRRSRAVRDRSGGRGQCRIAPQGVRRDGPPRVRSASASARRTRPGSLLRPRATDKRCRCSTRVRNPDRRRWEPASRCTTARPEGRPSSGAGVRLLCRGECSRLASLP